MRCDMEKKTVNILGTEYTIEYKEDEEVAKDMNCNVGECGGYCSSTEKQIVIAKFDKLHGENEQSKEYLQKWNMRHEITHAFLNESGLGDNSLSTNGWAKNEEMVDWFAIQSPKIFKVFQELDIL